MVLVYRARQYLNEENNLKKPVMQSTVCFELQNKVTQYFSRTHTLTSSQCPYSRLTRTQDTPPPPSSSSPSDPSPFLSIHLQINTPHHFHSGLICIQYRS